MGIALIILGVGLLLATLGYFFLNTSSETLQGIGIASSVVSVLTFLFSIMFWLSTGIEYANKKVITMRMENTRGVLNRMLQEDYNAENLRSALEFNSKQKICLYKESTFMWSYMGTNGVCGDTIAIPTGKFIPRQIIQLDTAK